MALIILDIILDVMTFFFMYLIFTSCLNLQQGMTGLTNLGLHFFAAIGAYIFAHTAFLALRIYGIELDYIGVDNNEAVFVLNKLFSTDLLTPIFTLFLTIILVMMTCAFLGYIFGRISLRLSGAYLGIFWLCLADSIEHIGMQYRPLAGGNQGVLLPDFFKALNDYSLLIQKIIVILISIITFALFKKISESPFGRLLKTIRENEIVSQSIGKNTNEIKVKIITFSSIFLGVAGVLVCLRTRGIFAESFNRIDVSFWPWLMFILGGSGNLLGSLLGTLICVVIRRIVLYSKFYLTFLPVDIIWIEPILLGVTLCITLLIKPRGILPEKPHKLKY